LIVRFSSIGDIVMTTPVIRLLKTQLEGEVEIDYITKQAHVSILDLNPHLNRVIGIQKHVSEVAQVLREANYDYVIDLHNNLRSRQVKRAIKALTFTIEKRNLAKWIYVRTKKEWLPIGHFTERCIAAVKPLGIVDDEKGLDFFIPKDKEISIQSLPERFHNGYVAYAIGGKMEGKVLPTRKIIELCENIEKPIVLLGGKEDAVRGFEISQRTERHVWNTCGKLDLQQSASFIKQAEVVITHDTGLMHIAAALGKRIISLWFATTPQLGFSPWRPGSGSVMIEADCEKRPTSKLGNRGFNDGCVFNVDLEKVVKEVNA
jgi:ADP-heptose:LPS heptosyltransferase